MQAPPLLLKPLEARFLAAHDENGWRINVGDFCWCRPSHNGQIHGWAFEEGFEAEFFRKDIELLKYVINVTFRTRQERRKCFGVPPHSSEMETTIETICELANEVWHDKGQQMSAGLIQ